MVQYQTERDRNLGRRHHGIVRVSEAIHVLGVLLASTAMTATSAPFLMPRQLLLVHNFATGAWTM